MGTNDRPDLPLGLHRRDHPGMGVQYAELPDWEFTVEEFQPGCYRVRAIRNGGITGAASGPDPVTLLDDLKRWATRIERGSSSST